MLYHVQLTHHDCRSVYLANLILNSKKISSIPVSIYLGFTMIELVMVIVVVGILAAMALPRFANLKVQAQLAANRAHAGTLRDTVGIVHVAWIAAGALPSTTVRVDGRDIQVNNYGWPSQCGAVGSTSPTQCADTLQYINGVGGCSSDRKPLMEGFPQVVAANGTVGGSCRTAPCSCTENVCYLASSPSSGICVYTLNGTNYTITYRLSTSSAGSVQVGP